MRVRTLSGRIMLENGGMDERRLTVMQAHLAKDCPDRANCWAKDIHDEYDRAREGREPRRREIEHRG